MYAVIATGGKQYRVEEGDVLRIEKVVGNVGDPFSFDRVLMLADGENLTVGRPVVDNAVVKAHIIEQDKNRKVIVFKFKRRKGYRKKQGHRQPYTAVKIDAIVGV